ncbi:glycerophosphodiester phosphodiesterase [Desulfitobacterium sp.]|uniref:glycerophosphodiester phosphodiesterase n=1 Tax=Desulfitobacterium sp. TaxID=49981 RepID=UPI002C917D20|nr:glycerophosphodiester phosphodiesterase [Desulfitobacterium sp.]HVJ48472.1 glycerophosphodiester phosphodiesterase [Desulfitobacterium sp.]
MVDPKIWITAHAGCMKTKDDSLESVIAGIAAGADIIEIDLRFTEENIPVLSHDEINPEQAKDLIQLEEVLVVLKGYPNIMLNIDLKEIKGIRFMDQVLQKTDMKERVFITGLEPDLIEAINLENMDISYFLDIPYLMNYTPDMMRLNNQDYLSELVTKVNQLKAIGINLYYEYLTHELVDIFHEAGKVVCVWTVDDEAAIKK